MSKITTKYVKACYALLRSLHPFNKWNLPVASKVRFVCCRDKTVYATYEPGPHTITVSTAKNGHLHTVLKSVAHEMVHLKLYTSGVEDWDEHDEDFEMYSAPVCEALGFDPKEF
jgi:hypothetical protein